MKVVELRPGGHDMHRRPRAARLEFDGDLLLLRAPGVHRRLRPEEIERAAIVGVREDPDDNPQSAEIRLLLFLAGRDQPYMVSGVSTVASPPPGAAELDRHARLCDRLQQWIEEIDRRRTTGELIIPKSTERYFRGRLPPVFPESELYQFASTVAAGGRPRRASTPVVAAAQASPVPASKTATSPTSIEAPGSSAAPAPARERVPISEWNLLFAAAWPSMLIAALTRLSVVVPLFGPFLFVPIGVMLWLWRTSTVVCELVALGGGGEAPHDASWKERRRVDALEAIVLCCMIVGAGAVHAVIAFLFDQLIPLKTQPFSQGLREGFVIGVHLYVALFWIWLFAGGILRRLRAPRLGSRLWLRLAIDAVLVAVLFLPLTPLRVAAVSFLIADIAWVAGRLHRTLT